MENGQSRSLFQPHTVTFDCWSTLIYEVDRGRAPAARARTLAQFAGTDEERAANALRDAWRRHQVLWHRREVFTGADITREALGLLGVTLDPEPLRELIDALESQALNHEFHTVDGAVEALDTLANAGVRRALICDTGYSPGRVVRRLLDRAGLLERLEVTVFSDEIGVPKPHPRAFQTALERLGVGPEGAVHVGDLRRSDVAGARVCGMGTVRLTAYHDDADTPSVRDAGVIHCVDAGCDPVCERPEADAVVGSFAELTAQLGY